jgi:hypothetical protein
LTKKKKSFKPSHSRITGNDWADEATKNALEEEINDRELYPPQDLVGATGRKHHEIQKGNNYRTLLLGALDVFQSGFRSDHSTVTLLNITDDIHASTHKYRGLFVVLVLLDFFKAFDSVDRDLLCHKL